MTLKERVEGLEKRVDKLEVCPGGEENLYEIIKEIYKILEEELGVSSSAGLRKRIEALKPPPKNL